MACNILMWHAQGLQMMMLCCASKRPREASSNSDAGAATAALPGASSDAGPGSRPASGPAGVGQTGPSGPASSGAAAAAAHASSCHRAPAARDGPAVPGAVAKGASDCAVLGSNGPSRRPTLAEAHTAGLHSTRPLPVPAANPAAAAAAVLSACLPWALAPHARMLISGPDMGEQGYGPLSAPASGVPLQAPLQTHVDRYRRRPGAAEKTLVKSPVKQVLMRQQETVKLVLQAWIQPHTPGALAPRELEDASQKKLGPRWRKGDRKYFCGMKPIYWEMERRQRATGMSDAAVMQEMDSEAKSLKPPLGLSPHQYAAAVSKRPDYKAFAEVKWAEYKAFDNTSGSRGSPAKAM